MNCPGDSSRLRQIHDELNEENFRLKGAQTMCRYQLMSHQTQADNGALFETSAPTSRRSQPGPSSNPMTMRLDPLKLTQDSSVSVGVQPSGSAAAQGLKLAERCRKSSKEVKVLSHHRSCPMT